MKKKPQKKLLKLAAEALAEHKRSETEALAILMNQIDRTKKVSRKAVMKKLTDTMSEEDIKLYDEAKKRKSNFIPIDQAFKQLDKKRK